MLKGRGGGGGGVRASVRVRVRVGGGGKFASLVFNKSLSRLAILLAQRRSFQRSRRIFLNLSIKKWKKKWKGLLTIPYLTLQMKASAHFLTSIIFPSIFLISSHHSHL